MKKAIATLRFGEVFNNIAKLTHPTLRAYATKVGADFVTISDKKFPTPLICYEKLQIRDLLSHYDRVLYLDTDILVRSDCPDLFSLVPPGWFGAFSEGWYQSRRDALEVGSQQFGYHIDHVMRWENRYFNAGVMLVDRTHRNAFVPPEVFYNNFEDQTWLNLQVLTKFPHRFLDLGPHFDRMSIVDWANRRESFIVHYAGGRFKELEEDAKCLK